MLLIPHCSVVREIIIPCRFNMLARLEFPKVEVFMPKVVAKL
jgi:hypothetical protein